MIRSHTVDIQGEFVGVAIDTGIEFRFRAVSGAADRLEQESWSSLAALRSAVRGAYLADRPRASGRAPANRIDSAASSLRLAFTRRTAPWPG